MAETSPFSLGPPPAEAALSVLLLHGFTGSPWELRQLGDSLASRGMHVTCPRLPGHGQTPEAMLYAGAPEWLAAAEAALASMKEARTVAIAGLSMGALLAMILAGRNRARVKAVALMAPALRLQAFGAGALHAIRRSPLFDLAPKWISKDGVDLEDDEMRRLAPALPRYPLKRVLDMFTLQDWAREAEPRLTCPSLVIGAVHDHVVELEPIHALHARLPFSEKLVLQRGFHQVVRDTDRALAISTVSHFLERLA